MAVVPKQIKNNLFTVGERIGKGSFGEVYKAKMKDGKEVAIKFEEQKENIRYLQDEILVNICHFTLLFLYFYMILL